MHPVMTEMLAAERIGEMVARGDAARCVRQARPGRRARPHGRCATEGDVGRALVNGREEDAARALDRWLALLPDRFYIELQRLGRADEESYIAAAVNLAGRRGVPVVATNDVRFLKPSDFESHEARVCIHDGTLLADTHRVRRYTNQQYLRSPEEMARLFADVPEALANSVEIARRASLAPSSSARCACLPIRFPAA